MPDIRLIEDWVAQLASVLGSMTGVSPTVECPDTPAQTPPPSGAIWIEQLFSVCQDGGLWIGAVESAWLEIGSSVLRAAEISEVDPETAQGTYREVISQTSSGTATQLTTRFGRPLEIADCRDSDPGELVSRARSVRLVFGNGTTIEIWVIAHPALEEILRLEGELAPTRRGDLDRHESETPVAAPKQLDLLLDVELPVSVSFGRAQLPLKDVIKLTTGSIIELNRSVSEPVEIIVNNCLIARGEVVVIEGNFGVRIHEIVNRQERLRALK